MKSLALIAVLLMCLCVDAATVNVTLNIPSLGLQNVPATLQLKGEKVSDYPNNGNMLSNYLFLVAAPSVPTNFNITFGQLQLAIGTGLVSSNVVITNVTAETINNVSNFTLMSFVTNLFVTQEYVSNLFVTNITVTGQGNGPWIANLQGSGTNTTLYALTVIDDFIFASTNASPVLDLVSNGVIQAGYSNSQWFGDGGGFTNLAYKYTTNSINSGTFAFGKEWTTNISGNIVLGNFTIGDNAALESMIIYVTNTGASVFTVTLPNGVNGAGDGRPPVYYSTNGANNDLEIIIEHVGQVRTNSRAQHYW